MLNITEVRVKLMRNRSDRLRAFCSITIDDDFVVHDLRVIEGRKGFFVAMPSRKLTDSCPKCGAKNELQAKYCCECGSTLGHDRDRQDRRSKDKLHVDVAHPINTACREMLQARVLEAYEQEKGQIQEDDESGQEAAGADDYQYGLDGAEPEEEPPEEQPAEEPWPADAAGVEPSAPLEEPEVTAEPDVLDFAGPLVFGADLDEADVSAPGATEADVAGPDTPDDDEPEAPEPEEEGATGGFGDGIL